MLLIGPEIFMNALGTVWAFTDCIKCDYEDFTETTIESKYFEVVSPKVTFAVGLSGITYIRNNSDRQLRLLD